LVVVSLAVGAVKFLERLVSKMSLLSCYVIRLVFLVARILADDIS